MGAVGGLMAAAALALQVGVAKSADSGGVHLDAWFHAGRQAERRTIRDQVARFNAAHRGEVRIDLTLIPEGSYNAQVQAAALAGDLPDLLELDGPYLPSYVWQGHLRPVGPYLPERLRGTLLPSIREQGTYRGRLYGVGVFDSGLGLYARRGALEELGVRIPARPEEAWSWREFEWILARLAERDPDGAVLDLHLAYRGEWYPYAFAPVLWSAGAGLVRETGAGRLRAEGIIDGPRAVFALRRVQHWIERGWVDPSLDNAAFPEGRVALSWGGHWSYPRYKEAAGEDLIVLPLPDFGSGTRTAMGSWVWAITRRCERPQAAGRFLAFLLRPGEVLKMARANGAVPGTLPALRRSELYGPGGDLAPLARQLRSGVARPRPQTPAYPVISDIFREAFADIRHGMDVQKVLDRAAREIDADIRANEGYRFPGEGAGL